MPTYDLRCNACGNRFERFLTRFIREEDKVCEVCGSKEVVVRPGGGYIASRTSIDRGGCAPRGGFG